MAKQLHLQQKHGQKENNLILTYSHPSPLSRQKFECNHFIECNKYLEKHNLDKIIW